MRLKTLITYLKKYWLSVAFFGYLIITTMLRSYTGIDVTIPCLIRYFTGQLCYGCGLTSAAIHLLRLDFYAAFQTNALVYVVLPLMGVLLVRHWRQFTKSQQQ